MSEKNSKSRKVVRHVYNTVEEARAAGAPGAKYRLWKVNGDGTDTFTFARSKYEAMINVAIASRGWVAEEVEEDAQTKASALLSQLSPEERQAVLAQFSQQTAGKGKGGKVAANRQ